MITFALSARRFALVFAATALLLAQSTPAQTTTRAEPEKRLNIIFILIDDLGKEWINCYGGENIDTPNIDRLASSGLRFENAYSMPQCTPTRACLLTGQYPFRNGWVNHWDVPRWGVGYYDWNKNACFPKAIKAAGYATAIAGKWQINDFRLQPNCLNDMGFDDYCMWTGGEGSLSDQNHERVSTRRYWDPYIHTKAGSKTYDGKFGPDIYNDFVLNFISQNAKQPFFIYYPMALTHGPLVHTPLEPHVTSRIDKHKAMVRYADHLLGKVLDRLDPLKLRDNTLIVWTTDNGTARGISNRMHGRVVPGGKGLTTENGVNAPFIVSCPTVVPAGVTDALVDFTDIAPTLAEVAAAQLESGYVYDGFSFVDVLLGKSKQSKRQWIMAMGGQAGVATDNGIENVFEYRD
ncbi:MAG: sulfatase-like hydrolase/transferase, partial [Planctomycetales bacterium]|nr:sulfatase-like hydrolase/transferase [Planctomycetales bacterium]